MSKFAKNIYLLLSLAPTSTAQALVNEEIIIAKEWLSEIIIWENIQKLFCPKEIKKLVNVFAAQCIKIKPGKVNHCAVASTWINSIQKEVIFETISPLKLFQSTL